MNIVFDLDGTLANCNHRQYLINGGYYGYFDTVLKNRKVKNYGGALHRICDDIARQPRGVSEILKIPYDQVRKISYEDIFRLLRLVIEALTEMDEDESIPRIRDVFGGSERLGDHVWSLVNANDLLWTSEERWEKFYDLCDGDEPIWKTIEVLKSLYQTIGNRVEIWTGRSEGKDKRVRRKTEDWITKFIGINVHDWEPDSFFCFEMRKIALRMRGHKDHRPDVEIKEEWLQKARAYGNIVSLAFEDRDRVVEMWRENEVMCYQVDYGDF